MDVAKYVLVGSLLTGCSTTTDNDAVLDAFWCVGLCQHVVVDSETETEGEVTDENGE